MADIIPIVNENDEIIKYKNRLEIQSEDIYRISGLWVEDSEGQILLAQRSYGKKNNPGKFGPAVAGTVEKDETYEMNIIKESLEEIGLDNLLPVKKQKVRVNENNEHNFFCQLFYKIVDKPTKEFKIKKDELECVKWYTKEDLLIQLNNSPDNFVPNLREMLIYFKVIKNGNTIR